MCGIAGGVWSHESKALSEDTLTRMLDSIRHRGPDDSGTYFSSPSEATCALGHRDVDGHHQLH